jgi:microcin C transport system permease protein
MKSNINIENNSPKSLFAKRLRKFKSFKRGYYSLIIIISLYILSWFLPVFVGRNALIVKYEGEYYFPLFNYYESSVFNQEISGEANYRLLKKQFEKETSPGFVVLPIIPYGPEENLLDELNETPPVRPSFAHWFGTDDRGRDVLSRIAYGFRISITFALIVAIFSFTVGLFTGALLGYYGGWFDIIGQRFIELWSTLPFLYLMIILSSLLSPNVFVLAVMLTLFSWMGITYYVRGEFYREKSKDYALSAYSAGASDLKIIFKHLLPNSLTPVISFAPFAVVGNISALVSLDFLGFGVPPPTPSWGQLISQGMNNISNWWLVLFPLGCVFLTLIAIVFIGESLREAFNPKGNENE